MKHSSDLSSETKYYQRDKVNDALKMLWYAAFCTLVEACVAK